MEDNVAPSWMPIIMKIILLASMLPVSQLIDLAWANAAPTWSPPGFTETIYIYNQVNCCVLGYPEVQFSGQVPTGLPLRLYLCTLVMDCLRIKNASLIFFVTD